MRYFRIVADAVVPVGQSPSIIHVDTEYAGKNPMQAAKKVFTHLAKTSQCSDCSYIFSIAEMRDDSKIKTFTYKGSREKLKEPIVKTKDNSTFHVNYNTVVRSHKLATAVCTTHDEDKQQIWAPSDCDSADPGPIIAKKIIPPRITRL